MANMIPGNPPQYDKSNLQGTIKEICKYERTTLENMDFALSQMKKEISALTFRVSSLEKK